MGGKVIFILAVIMVDISSGSTLAENDVKYKPLKLGMKMLRNVSPRKVYPLSKGWDVTQNRPITINLTRAGVPKDAYEVIVDVLVRTGYVRKGQWGGAIVVSSNTTTGLIQRKLHYYSYAQQAYSYNSENMIIPITPGMTKSIEAKVVGPKITGRFYARVQIVGYASP